MQYIMNGIHSAWLWAQTPEALVSPCSGSCAISSTNRGAQFAFKMVFITIALWIPSVCRSSARECCNAYQRLVAHRDVFGAEFIYEQKGLWYAASCVYL